VIAAGEIQELLEKEPFAPFRLMLSNGKSHDVVRPGNAVVLKREVFLAFPDGEHWALIPLLHIAAIESIRNGKGARRRRK